LTPVAPVAATSKAASSAHSAPLMVSLTPRSPLFEMVFISATRRAFWYLRGWWMPHQTC
jgi:hypothetical protein